MHTVAGAVVLPLVMAACGGEEVPGGSRGEVVVDSWGGSFQDDQTEVIFDPFQDETGIEVVQLSDGENIYAKVEAQAGRQTGDIDLVHGDASWLERGTLSGLWAPVDEDATGAADLYEDARDTNGVGILYYSYNIVYNTEELDPGEAPRSWARGPRRGRFDIQ